MGTLTRMLSSTAIGSLKSRSKSGRLRTVFVHSGGKPSMHLALSLHQSTQEDGEIGSATALTVAFRSLLLPL